MLILSVQSNTLFFIYASFFVKKSKITGYALIFICIFAAR